MEILVGMLIENEAWEIPCLKSHTRAVTLRSKSLTLHRAEQLQQVEKMGKNVSKFPFLLRHAGQLQGNINGGLSNARYCTGPGVVTAHKPQVRCFNLNVDIFLLNCLFYFLHYL